ncbi:MAG: hypothetical protein ACR2KP_17800 [Egibacteraceae bacterium]
MATDNFDTDLSDDDTDLDAEVDDADGDDVVPDTAPDSDEVDEDDDAEGGAAAEDDEPDDVSLDDDEPDEEEEDDEEEAEQSLEVLLGQDDDAPVDEPRHVSPVATVTIREGEFTCRSCFLVKRRAQLADPERLICFDCV